MEKDTFEVGNIEEAGQPSAVGCCPSVSRVGVSGRYDVEGNGVSAGGDGGFAPYLVFARPVDGARFEGMTEEGVVDVKTADGVVGAYGDALEE